MSFKLSIFTTITNPYHRGDTVDEALACYVDLTDEVVVFNGGSEMFVNYGRAYDQIIYTTWPKEFNWDFIGKAFQRGYEACTGDWVIHADLDFIFHENDFEEIRLACISNNDKPAFSMLKRQFILPDRFNLKSRLVVAVNKGRFGNRIRFDSGGDLCQPSLDGKYIEPGSVPDIKIPIWNYEKILKTEPQIIDDVGRMARAWQRHFGTYKLGGPDDLDAYKEWLYMVKGRFSKPSEHVRLEDHPKYIQETIKNLKPMQWGFSGFNNLEMNTYAQSN